MMFEWIKVGQIWQVFDKKEFYLARILAIGAERVKIVRVVPPHVMATPTFARITMFTKEHQVYTYSYLREGEA